MKLHVNRDSNNKTGAEKPTLPPNAKSAETKSKKVFPKESKNFKHSASPGNLNKITNCFDLHVSDKNDFFLDSSI